MSRYLITLTPVDKFFFGGEMKFSVGAEKAQNESYIIESNMFPQQTSLLGMLRFLLLRNSNYFGNGHITNPAEASKLIGPRSFSVSQDGAFENDFGHIKLISRCFIQRLSGDKCEDLDMAPYDSEFDVSFDENSCKGMYNGIGIQLPDISRKDKSTDKKGYEYTKRMCCESTGVTIPLDEIFVCDNRLGINRDIEKGTTEDNALYKQVNLRFNTGKGVTYRFAFYADVESVKLEEYNGQLVSLGADNSVFTLGVTIVEEDKDNANGDSLKVTLLSPAFLDKSVWSIPCFSISETIPFRFLQADVADTKSYNIINKGLKQSERYELYDSGSVFFFKNEEDKKKFTHSLDAKKAFRQIGYNQYK